VDPSLLFVSAMREEVQYTQEELDEMEAQSEACAKEIDELNRSAREWCDESSCNTPRQDGPEGCDCSGSYRCTECRAS